MPSLFHSGGFGEFGRMRGEGRRGERRGAEGKGKGRRRGKVKSSDVKKNLLPGINFWLRHCFLVQ